MSDFEKNLDKAVENYEKTFDKASQVVDKASVGVSRLLTGCVTLVVNLFLAAFCLWGAYAAMVNVKLQTSGEVTTGRVVRLEETRTEDGSCCVYTPVIEFEAGGQTYSFENAEASDSSDFQIGTEVQVRYDPADPATAQIDNSLGRWLFPAIIIPAMLLTALIINITAIRYWKRGEIPYDL